MVRIPTYDLPQVLPEAPPTPNASPEAFGAGIGRAVQGLGAQVSRSANVFQEHALRFQREQNENAAFEAESQFSIRAAELETQFMMLEGNQQAASYADYQKQVSALRDEVMGSAQNDYTRRLVERATANRYENILTTASRSAALNNRDYMANAAVSRVELSQQNAASGDEERFGLELGNIEKNITWLSGVKGWDAATTEVERKKAVSAAIFNRAASEARVNPFAARDRMSQMGNEMLPEHRLQLETAIRESITSTQVKKDQQAFLNGQVPGVDSNFREVLGARESAGSGGYTAVNTLGYIGKYQFGTARAKDIGIYSADDNNAWKGTFKIPGHPEVKTMQDFLANPAAQEVAFDLHDKKMEREIKANGFDKFEGQVVDGVMVTRNGIKAALHLGGVGGTSKFLNGRGSEEDKYGTGVKDYMRLGGGTSTESLPKITPETSDAEFARVVEAARKHARTVAKDIPEYEERLIAGLETDRGVMQTKKKEEADARFDQLYRLVLPDNTNDAGLTEIPAEYMPIFNQLTGPQQNTLLAQLKENASPEKQVETPQQLANYYRLLGKRQQGLSPAEISVTNLATKHRTELMKEATAPKSNTAEPDIGEVMGDLKVHVDALSLDDDQKSQLQGRMVEAIDQFRRDNNGKNPTDADIQSMFLKQTRKTVTVRWGPLPNKAEFAFETLSNNMDKVRARFPNETEEQIRQRTMLLMQQAQ